MNTVIAVLAGVNLTLWPAVAVVLHHARKPDISAHRNKTLISVTGQEVTSV